MGLSYCNGKSLGGKGRAKFCLSHKKQKKLSFAVCKTTLCFFQSELSANSTCSDNSDFF